MLTVGYLINELYPRNCCKLPMVTGQTECRPVFVFALAYLSFEKFSSIMDGTRIRGVGLLQKETLETTGYLSDFMLFKLIT